MVVPMGSRDRSSTKKVGIEDMAKGGMLQCVEALTLGQPFEVWKTRMGKYRNESTIEAFKAIKSSRGVSGFWQGTGPKLVESGTKGAVLLYSKELLLNTCLSLGISDTKSGFIAGAGAGVCQTVVMGPCTFAVTALVNTQEKISVTSKCSDILRTRGIRGLYPGGSAIALRQATNWASRQGLTEWVRQRLLALKDHDSVVHNSSIMPLKLTAGEEILSGMIGGSLSTWNQPFEVARIQMQSAASEGKPKQNIFQVFNSIIRHEGPGGLFKGIIPRIGLSVWQTLFMVTGARLIRESLGW